MFNFILLTMKSKIQSNMNSKIEYPQILSNFSMSKNLNNHDKVDTSQKLEVQSKNTKMENINSLGANNALHNLISQVGLPDKAQMLQNNYNEKFQ